VALVTSVFHDVVKSVAFKAGMPHERFVFVPHPVAGQSSEVLRNYLSENDPATHVPILEEIISALTAPLNENEKVNGLVDRTEPRFLGPDTEENLNRFFLSEGWTDGLPIVLPTEERVERMLTGTSRKPDELVGRMRPTITQEPWDYTVEKVAVNAVMAGAEPEFLPVILALAASGETALHSSTSSFASMVVVNGPIRNEIGMNSGIGALGPFNHANAAIGRAYSLLSRNLGGGAVPGKTYLGSQGNPLNYVNICFAENEERSPWEPLHVQKGFGPDESMVSIFRGRGFNHLLDVRHKTWQQQFVNLVSAITPIGSNLTLLVEPIIARTLKEREHFNSKEDLAAWFHENAKVPAELFWDYQIVINYVEPQAIKGVEPYASWLKLHKDAMIPRFADPKGINVVVVGGETNAYWYAAEFAYLTSLSVDEWR
jgi:hypothetical protein